MALKDLIDEAFQETEPAEASAGPKTPSRLRGLIEEEFTGQRKEQPEEPGLFSKAIDAVASAVTAIPKAITTGFKSVGPAVAPGSAAPPKDVALPQSPAEDALKATSRSASVIPEPVVPPPPVPIKLGPQPGLAAASAEAAKAPLLEHVAGAGQAPFAPPVPERQAPGGMLGRAAAKAGLVSPEAAKRRAAEAEFADSSVMAKPEGVDPGWWQVQQDIKAARRVINAMPNEFANRVLLGVPNAIKDTFGFDSPQARAPQSTAEAITAATGDLAGFIVGPAKAAHGLLATNISKWLLPKAGDTLGAIMAKSIANETATLAVASGLAHAGDYATADSLKDAFQQMGEHVKGGAVLGATFGGVGNVIPANTLMQRAARLGVGLGILDVVQGTSPGDDRALAQKVYDYGLNIYFLWKGKDPRQIKAQLDAIAAARSKPGAPPVTPEVVLKSVLDKAMERAGKLKDQPDLPGAPPADRSAELSAILEEELAVAAGPLKTAVEVATEKTGGQPPVAVEPGPEIVLAGGPRPAARPPRPTVPTLSAPAPGVPAGPVRIFGPAGRPTEAPPAPVEPEMPAPALKSAQELAEEKTKGLTRPEPPAPQVPPTAVTSKALGDRPAAGMSFKDYVEASGKKWPITAKDPDFARLRFEFDDFRKGLYEARPAGAGRWAVINRKTGEEVDHLPSGAKAQLEANRLNGVVTLDAWRNAQVPQAPVRMALPAPKPDLSAKPAPEPTVETEAESTPGKPPEPEPPLAIARRQVTEEREIQPPPGNRMLDTVKDPGIRRMLEEAKPGEVGGLPENLEAERKTAFDTPEIIQLRRDAAKIAPTIKGKESPDPSRERIDTIWVQELNKIRATGPVRQEKRIWIVMGPPAAGKSGILVDPIIKEQGARLIDSDAIKQGIPEAAGGRYNDKVHEESDRIANIARREAMRNNDNIVMPIVGKGYESALKYIDEARRYGYEVNLRLMDLPGEAAAFRTTNRILEGLRGDRGGGVQVVDPSYALTIGQLPRENYVRLVNEGRANHDEAFSNDVPRGAKPRRLTDAELGIERPAVARPEQGREAGPSPAGGRAGEGGASEAGLRRVAGEPGPGGASAGPGRRLERPRGEEVGGGSRRVVESEAPPPDYDLPPVSTTEALDAGGLRGAARTASGLMMRLMREGQPLFRAREQAGGSLTPDRLRAALETQRPIAESGVAQIDTTGGIPEFVQAALATRAYQTEIAKVIRDALPKVSTALAELYGTDVYRRVEIRAFDLRVEGPTPDATERGYLKGYNDGTGRIFINPHAHYLDHPLASPAELAADIAQTVIWETLRNKYNKGWFATNRVEGQFVEMNSLPAHAFMDRRTLEAVERLQQTPAYLALIDQIRATLERANDYRAFIEDARRLARPGQGALEGGGVLPAGIESPHQPERYGRPDLPLAERGGGGQESPVRPGPLPGPRPAGDLRLREPDSRPGPSAPPVREDLPAAGGSRPTAVARRQEPPGGQEPVGDFDRLKPETRKRLVEFGREVLKDNKTDFASWAKAMREKLGEKSAGTLPGAWAALMQEQARTQAKPSAPGQNQPKPRTEQDIPQSAPPIDPPPEMTAPQLKLGLHKDVVDAARDLFQSGKIERDRSKLISDDILDNIRDGKLRIEDMARILDARGMSFAEFGAQMFRPAITDAAKRLGALGQLQRRLNELESELGAGAGKPPTPGKPGAPGEKERMEKIKTIGDILDAARVIDPKSVDTLAWWRRADNIRRGMLVTQLATSVRNFTSQVGRLGLDVLDQGIQGGLQRAFGKDVTAHPADSMRALMDVFAQINPSTHKAARERVDALLEGLPREQERLFNNYASDLARAAKKQGAEKAVDTAIRAGEKAVDLLNVFNRFQEYVVRRAVFQAELAGRLRARGIDIERAVTDQAVRREIPVSDIRAAIEKALEVTFASTPAYGSAGYHFVKWVNKMGPFATWMVPFPRFMVNAMKFYLEFSPVGLVKAFTPAEIQKFRQGDTKTMSRGLLGLGLLSTAYLIRSMQDEDTKWNEVRFPGMERTIDVRPLNPFASYLFVADILYRIANDKLYGGGLATEAVRNILGANVRGGTGLQAVDQLVDGLRDIGDTKQLTKYLQGAGGHLIAGLLTPLQQFTDVYAEFDPESQIVRNVKEQPFSGPIKQRLPAPLVEALGGELPEEKASPTSAEPVRRESPGVRQVTGLTFGKAKNDFEKEVDRLQIPYREILPSQGDARLDNIIAKHLGPMVEEAGSRLVNSPRYDRLGEIGKRLELKAYLQRARKQAKAKALMDREYRAIVREVKAGTSKERLAEMAREEKAGLR